MSNRRFVDLHTHSTASDGSLPPGNVVRLADQARLAALALTDHDTIAGLEEARRAAADFPDLTLVPGIEVSAIFPHGTLHILGLGLDTDSPRLADLMAELQNARATRNPKILQKLADMGMNVSMQDVLDTARNYAAGIVIPGMPESSHKHARTTNRVIGRLHIAIAMVRKGYIKNTDEAFAKYIGDGGPAYVDKERLTPRQAIEAIHAAGGLAVLAHPPQLQCENDAQFLRILRDMIHAGLDGIEAYHSENTPQQTRLYVECAKRFDLGVTGGSDFHGMGKPHVALGHPKVSIESMGPRFAARLLHGTTA